MKDRVCHGKAFEFYFEFCGENDKDIKQGNENDLCSRKIFLGALEVIAGWRCDKASLNIGR